MKLIYIHLLIFTHKKKTKSEEHKWYYKEKKTEKYTKVH